MINTTSNYQVLLQTTIRKAKHRLFVISLSDNKTQRTDQSSAEKNCTSKWSRMIHTNTGSWIDTSLIQQNTCWYSMKWKKGDIQTQRKRTLHVRWEGIVPAEKGALINELVDSQKAPEIKQSKAQSFHGIMWSAISTGHHQKILDIEK